MQLIQRRKIKMSKQRLSQLNRTYCSY